MYQCRDARYDEVEFGETRSHQRLPRFVVCGGMWAPEAQSTDRSVDWLQPRALVAPCHLVPVVGPVKHGLFMSADIRVGSLDRFLKAVFISPYDYCPTCPIRV